MRDPTQGLDEPTARRLVIAMMLLMSVMGLVGFGAVFLSCTPMLAETLHLTGSAGAAQGNRFLRQGTGFMVYVWLVTLFSGAGPLFTAWRLHEGLSRKPASALAPIAVRSAVTWVGIFFCVWWSWIRMRVG